MLFNSIEFLFFFLPVVLFGFIVLQRRGKSRLVMAWLTLSSLFFYGWWNPTYLWLLGLSIAVNYSLGGILSGRDGLARRGLLAVGITFNLGLLAYFKYGNFFIDNIVAVTDISFNFSHIILPLAISFYTFQQITYLVDASKGLTDSHGFLEYCLFVSFFPQLIAGPIVHHREMLGQFKHLGEARDNWRNCSVGLSILTIGLFKKVVIADSFALFATPVFTIADSGQTLHVLESLAGAFSYAMQLYFDFSGYSDMAIGLACMFGLKLPVNFYSPYRAQNISDFWRMWHATLSRFLRDYVYTPLGGFLCSPRRQRFNLFMTMFAGGVWHGAGWTFFLYGVCHGLYVVIHQLWRINVSGPLNLVGKAWYKALAQLLTFLVVVFTLVLFRAETLAAAVGVYQGLLHSGQWVFSPAYLQQLQDTNIFAILSMSGLAVNMMTVVFGTLVLATAACWLLPSTWQLFQSFDVAYDQPPTGRGAVLQIAWQPRLGWAVFIAFLFVACCLNLTQVSEFLYFQF
jgi:D-alanyl-lipoteichoic acid acyltransferase DltB (MBOAT superfamily)